MMYFRAKTAELDGAAGAAVTEALHNKQNTISHFLHSSRRGKGELNLSDKNVRENLSDFSACLVTSYFLHGQLDNAYFFRNCMRTCRDILLKLGFRAEHEAQGLNDISAYEHINSIVFGYQDERGLERRIEAFVGLVEKIEQTQKVIFSGAHSASTAIRIPDEATEMRIKFDAICKRKGFDAKNVRFEREGASKDTIANLNNCINGAFLIAGDGVKGQQTLVLISSTFHLIRIAEEIRNIIGSKDNPLLKNVNEIFLVGAEDDTMPFVTADQEYVKNMMFDIFRKELA